MKILSRYKDYYDYLQKYGQDESIVYTRKPQVVQLNFYPFQTSTGMILINKVYESVNHALLYFCGEYKNIYKIRSRDENMLREQKFYLLSLEGYPTLAKKLKEKCGSFGYKYHTKERFIDSKIIKFFEKNKPENVPVAILDEEGIIYNPILSNINLANIYPAEQAYQRIAQYLANVGDGSKTKYKGKEIIPQISDKDMAAAKGFDKYSFRKEKNKVEKNERRSSN